MSLSPVNANIDLDYRFLLASGAVIGFFLWQTKRTVEHAGEVVVEGVKAVVDNLDPTDPDNVANSVFNKLAFTDPDYDDGLGGDTIGDKFYKWTHPTQ